MLAVATCLYDVLQEENDIYVKNERTMTYSATLYVTSG